MSLTLFPNVNVAAAKRSAVEMFSSVHSSVVSSTLSSSVQLMSHFRTPTLLTLPNSFLPPHAIWLAYTQNTYDKDVAWRSRRIIFLHARR